MRKGVGQYGRGRLEKVDGRGEEDEKGDIRVRWYRIKWCFGSIRLFERLQPWAALVSLYAESSTGG